MLSALLPVVHQKNLSAVAIQIEESRVLRSDSSILSNSPLLSLQAYGSSEGFRPDNSMANINSPIIADLTIKGKDNNIDNINQKKLPNLYGNRLYESQIIESPCQDSVVKVNIFQHEKRMPSFLR